MNWTRHGKTSQITFTGTSYGSLRIKFRNLKEDGTIDTNASSTPNLSVCDNTGSCAINGTAMSMSGTGDYYYDVSGATLTNSKTYDVKATNAYGTAYATLSPTAIGGGLSLQVTASGTSYGSLRIRARYVRPDGTVDTNASGTPSLYACDNMGSCPINGPSMTLSGSGEYYYDISGSTLTNGKTCLLYTSDAADE